MAKRHATDDVDTATHTLCGLALAGRVLPSLKIDNADPNCGRCLRVIKSRIAVAESALPCSTPRRKDCTG